jgi:hypothetical protein
MSIFQTPELPHHKNSVTLTAGGEDMLRVAADGFYVRGIKVPVDDNEALTVYNSFQQWLTWAQLQRSHE